jgi:hypothetical protein
LTLFCHSESQPDGHGFEGNRILCRFALFARRRFHAVQWHPRGQGRLDPARAPHTRAHRDKPPAHLQPVKSLPLPPRGSTAAGSGPSPSTGRAHHPVSGAPPGIHAAAPARCVAATGSCEGSAPPCRRVFRARRSRLLDSDSGPGFAGHGWWRHFRVRYFKLEHKHNLVTELF